MRPLAELTRNFDAARVPVKEADRKAGPYPYFGASGVVDYVDAFLFDGEYLLVAEDGENLRTRKTPIAFLASGRFWVNNHAHVLQANEAADNRYLMYALVLADISGYLTGSTMPKLTQANLLRIPVSAPPPTEQRRIAGILGAFDNKIALKRRMASALEAVAQATYKSWFVDFEPVRARASGRSPGLPESLADLFPARLVDSDFGQIPEGWEVRKIGELLELAYGKALTADSRKPGSVPVYGSSGQVGWHDERLVQGPGVVVGRKGNPGVVTWSAADFYPIDTAFYVVPSENCPSLHFLYFALLEQDLSSLGADSAVPGLSRSLAYLSDQVLPPANIRARFEALASPLFLAANEAREESHTLEAMRDAMLPLLISGRLRIDELDPALDGGL